jgi:CPA2 family monovalent cation:H+ antiporter-2
LVIAITIAIATTINITLKKYDIPTVIGYILSGIVIGTAFDISGDSRESLSHLAEFGIVFLMFTVGLEFSFKEMKKMKHEVFTIGALQIGVSSIIFYLMGHYFFGIENKAAIIIGLAISLSSTAIVLKMLNENGDINAGYGKASLGVLLFQDLAVIPILLMISFFTTPGKEV